MLYTIRIHYVALLLALLSLNAWADEPAYRVMSFNIRYGTANDGDNRWPLRKELVAETIRRFSPDLLGTQEIMPFQAKYLSQQLEDYEYVGKLREPDQDDGEQCGIFFRRDRFIDLEQGHFWLSSTPDLPGSKSWDSSLPRMVTWVKLFDRRNQRRVFLFNTHFDHVGREARRESAGVLRDRISKLVGADPVIVTGDFNCDEGSAPYRVLVTDNKSQNPLVDSLRVHRPSRAEAEGTFGGFTGRNSGSRIDWVLVSTQWRVNSAAIDTYNRDGRYPSDHYPVTTVLELP